MVGLVQAAGRHLRLTAQRQREGVSACRAQGSPSAARSLANEMGIPLGGAPRLGLHQPAREIVALGDRYPACACAC